MIISENFRIVEFQIGVNIVGLPIYHKHVIDDSNDKFIRPKRKR